MPVQIHAIKDGIDLALSSATGIELVQINTRTYALVASNSDNAMQIIDITHPQLPFPVSTVQKSSTEYSTERTSLCCSNASEDATWQNIRDCHQMH